MQAGLSSLLQMGGSGQPRFGQTAPMMPAQPGFGGAPPMRQPGFGGMQPSAPFMPAHPGFPMQPGAPSRYPGFSPVGGIPGTGPMPPMVPAHYPGFSPVGGMPAPMPPTRYPLFSGMAFNSRINPGAQSQMMRPARLAY